jgi:hypothetical protein
MTSFIQSQADNHRKASEILTSIQVKLEVLAEMTRPNPNYREYLNKQLDQLYLQYHDVMKRIIEPIIRENEYTGVIIHRQDVVTIAESFYT